MQLTQSKGTKEKKREEMHVDEFIDYGTFAGVKNEDYARWILLHFRLSASLKNTVDRFMRENKLFCNYDGKRYRVTGASRMGDVWLAGNFERVHGYDLRVDVLNCSNWSKDKELK